MDYYKLTKEIGSSRIEESKSDLIIIIIKKLKGLMIMLSQVLKML